MGTIEIIFLGLIAVAFDEKDVPGQTGGGELKPAYEPFDVYLVKVPDQHDDHVAELLVRRSDLGTDVGDDTRSVGACPRKNGKGEERKKCMNKKLEPAGCSANDAIYAVWCLDGYEISFDQHSDSAPHFSAGYRTASDDRRKRHFKDHKPGWFWHRRRDVSWVPEMSKVVEAARIIRKPEEKSTAMLLGLNGTLSADGMPRRPWKQHRWSWRELKSDHTTQNQTTWKDYEQSFAEAFRMELGVASQVIKLSRKHGPDTESTDIELVSKPEHPIKIVNRPIRSDPIKPVGGLCTADHFKYHYILADIGKQEKLVPYTKSRRKKCPKPPLTFAGVGHAMAVSNSFCPPTILRKPPSNP